MSVVCSGPFESLERADARLRRVVPATRRIMLVLLHPTLGRFGGSLPIMAPLPSALAGGLGFRRAMGGPRAIATGMGVVAPAGVAAEFGVVMLRYLGHALADRTAGGRRTAPLRSPFVVPARFAPMRRGRPAAAVR